MPDVQMPMFPVFLEVKKKPISEVAYGSGDIKKNGHDSVCIFPVGVHRFFQELREIESIIK